MEEYNLKRFLDAQNQAYTRALSEINAGKKTSHWMWYIFPQLHDLGRSETAKFYGILDLAEATAYLKHPVLGKHLIEISSALLTHKNKSATEIFGSPDDLKLRSSATLFSSVRDSDPVFQHILNQYFMGEPDKSTLELLGD